jgi:hypothetical protein
MGRCRNEVFDSSDDRQARNERMAIKAKAVVGCQRIQRAKLMRSR